MRHCKLCDDSFVGRPDKIFCTIKCKSEYSRRLNAATKKATSRIDTILHRNRSILLEIMGKSIKQKRVYRSMLDRKKFNWHYITHQHMNVQNKIVNYVYDFSWMIFSDQDILIKRILKEENRKLGS